MKNNKVSKEHTASLKKLIKKPIRKTTKPKKGTKGKPTKGTKPRKNPLGY